MPCICQYFAEAVSDEHSLGNSHTKRANSDGEVGATSTITTKMVNANDIDCSESCVSVCASELAASNSQIWLLERNLSDAQVSIEALENLVKTMIKKQNQLMTEMYELKRVNLESQAKCEAQSDYQILERNAMLQELHEIKERLVCQNSELSDSLQDANEKIYMMGMKFLKLKRRTRSSSSSGSTQSLSLKRIGTDSPERNVN